MADRRTLLEQELRMFCNSRGGWNPTELADHLMEYVLDPLLKEQDRWKAEALPVLEGLQELGRALDLPLGERTTGPAALAAVSVLKAERDRLQHLLGSHADGHLCTCKMTSPGSHINPPEWEQDPWCPTHPDMGPIMAEVTALRQQVARMTSLAEEYEADARAEGYGGELWGITAEAIREALDGPAPQPNACIQPTAEVGEAP